MTQSHYLLHQEKYANDVVICDEDIFQRLVQTKTVSQEVELPLATSSQHGLMSIADKEKISAMESELSALEARVAALENK